MEETTELSIVERVLRIREQMGLDPSLSAQSLQTLMTEFAVDGSAFDAERGGNSERTGLEIHHQWRQWSEFNDEVPRFPGYPARER